MKTLTLPPSITGQLPRLITGILLAVVLIASLVLGGTYLAVFLAIASVLALFEFFQMLLPGKTNLPSKIFGLLLGALLFCPVGQPHTTSVILTLAFLWTAIAFLVDYGRGNDAANLTRHAALPLGLLYIPILLHLALALSLKEQFLVVVAAFASDTAAYYAGCAFGRRKIWPRVSPKKSWEGSIAGFAATVLATVCIACIPYGDGPLHGGNIFIWIVVGAFLNVAAQVGDFFESALKRTYGIKDSSALLPGHGGILDRIDSVLFTLAAYSAILFIWSHAAKSFAA